MPDPLTRLFIVAICILIGVFIVIQLCAPKMPVRGNVLERNSLAFVVFAVSAPGAMIGERVLNYLAERFDIAVFAAAANVCSVVGIGSAVGLGLLVHFSDEEQKQAFIEGILKPRTIMQNTLQAPNNKGAIAWGDRNTQTVQVSLNNSSIYDFIEAVKGSTDTVMQADDREAALAHLCTLAEQCSRPEESREPIKIMAALEIVKKLFSASGVFVETFPKVEEFIRSHLPK